VAALLMIRSFPKEITEHQALMSKIFNVYLKKSKGKGYPCTETDALYRPYGP
jgi:hypothetical protein